METILEGMRKRPGMYIGSTDDLGLSALTRTLIAFAIDSFLAGNGSTIIVDLLPDGGVRVISDALILPGFSANEVSTDLKELFLRPFTAPRDREPG